MTVEIVRVRPGDEALFDRVHDDVFDEPVRKDRVAAYLASEGHLMLLALDGGLVVGQCAAVIHRHPDKATELYIDNLGVAEGWRRQGIARRMVTEMFAIGRALGCEEAWVGTEPDNSPARALYRGFGKDPESFVMYVCDL